MDNVLDRVDELIDLIKNDPKYLKYIELKEIIKKDKDISQLINDIKTNQKQIVRLTIEKKDISELENNIKSDLDTLNSYPIYLEFSYLQEDLNILYQDIKNSIENHINDITN